MLEKIKETAHFIKNIIKETPDFAIVLGSGLGKLQKEVEPIHVLEYQDIPNFPQTTVVAVSYTHLDVYKRQTLYSSE